MRFSPFVYIYYLTGGMSIAGYCTAQKNLESDQKRAAGKNIIGSLLPGRNLIFLWISVVSNGGF